MTTPVPLPMPDLDADQYRAFRDATVRRQSAGGQFTVRLLLRDTAPVPMKGGQGLYRPEGALLIWTTVDGQSWTFDHAVVTGPQCESDGSRRPYGCETAQTVYLNDRTYLASEPAWLSWQVALNAPGKP